MKKLLKILYIIILIIIVANISYAKFMTKINGQGKAEVKQPILIFKKSDIINGQISKTNNLYENTFSFKNYFENSEKVNEIEFEYIIKILPSTLNFPVKYNLINLDTNTEVELNENFETEKIFMGTEKIIHNYKLKVSWDENLSASKVEEVVDVKMQIKAVQIKKES